METLSAICWLSRIAQPVPVERDFQSVRDVTEIERIPASVQRGLRIPSVREVFRVEPVRGLGPDLNGLEVWFYVKG